MEKLWNWYCRLDVQRDEDDQTSTDQSAERLLIQNKISKRNRLDAGQLKNGSTSKVKKFKVEESNEIISSSSGPTVQDSKIDSLQSLATDQTSTDQTSNDETSSVMEELYFVNASEPVTGGQRSFSHLLSSLDTSKYIFTKSKYSHLP